MNTKFSDPLVHQPITELPLSDELIDACERNNFKTLADLLELHMTTIIPLPGFDHNVWHEYAQFLEDRKLGHYLN